MCHMNSPTSARTNGRSNLHSSMKTHRRIWFWNRYNPSTWSYLSSFISLDQWHFKQNPRNCVINNSSWRRNHPCQNKRKQDITKWCPWQSVEKFKASKLTFFWQQEWWDIRPRTQLEEFEATKITFFWQVEQQWYIRPITKWLEG